MTVTRRPAGAVGEPPGVVPGGAAAARRLAGQWLGERRPRSVADVVGHLLAVQAQDLQGARLAVRARAAGVTAADVDAALDAGRLVVTWLNRGTLHLVRAEDYRWLHALTAPRTLTGNARRLREEGVDPEQAERGIALVVETIAAEGPQTRGQLRDRLDRAGIPTAGQALVHLLGAASLRGLLVRGPVHGGEQAFVLVDGWLGPAPDPLPRDEALTRLARRYLAGHRPAQARDLAAWAGITLGDARRGLAGVGLPDGDGASLPDGDGAGRSDATGAGRPGPTETGNLPVAFGPAGSGSGEAEVAVPLPPPRLLGPFDPVLHGWPDREWVVGPYRHVVTVNGLFRPVVLVGGRVVGTWGRPRGTVTLDLFEEVDPAVREALEVEAVDVRRFLGG